MTLHCSSFITSRSVFAGMGTTCIRVDRIVADRQVRLGEHAFDIDVANGYHLFHLTLFSTAAGT